MVEDRYRDIEEILESRILWSVIGIASLASLLLMFRYESIIYQYILYGIGFYLLARFYFFIKYKALFTPDILMATVALVSSYTGYYREGFIVMILYSIAEIVEEVAEEIAIRRLTATSKIVPDRVLVVRDEGVVEVETEKIEPGWILMIRRGEAVPVDGILLEPGVFDTRYITGEPIPRSFEKGEPVASGYINAGDAVKVYATKKAEESTLQLVISYSRKIVEAKSSIQRLIERMMPYLTVLVIASSIIAYTSYSIRGLVSVLIAGCPSAYLLSSSVSVLASVAIAARRGIVIKESKYLERANKVRVVVFDKTGTLTLGSPQLVEIRAPAGYREEEVLRLAASTASASVHPLSRAIVREAEKRRLKIPIPRRIRDIPGKGVEAYVDGVRVKIGSKSFVGYSELEVSCNGATVYVGVDGSVGYLCFKDVVESGARKIVDMLKSSGMKVIIASGDKKSNVEEVARELGVDEYYYELSPQKKLELIENLREKYGYVAMVGDGVNDLEALASADIGIAVGDLDLVIETADVVVNRIERVVDVFRSSKAYILALLAAFSIASIIKIVAIIGGFSGVMPLWLVVLLGDDGATLASLAVSTSVLTYGISRFY